MGNYKTEKSRRDEMIIMMTIYDAIKPRRGGIYFTPSGLRYYSIVKFYNHFTPSGFVKFTFTDFYNSYTPSGLKS